MRFCVCGGVLVYRGVSSFFFYKGLWKPGGVEFGLAFLFYSSSDVGGTVSFFFELLFY